MLDTLSPIGLTVFGIIEHKRAFASQLLTLNAGQRQVGSSLRCLHSLYSSPSVIRMIKSMRMRWAGHVARMGERRKAYRILVGKPRRRRRWLDNIKIDLIEIGWDGLDRSGSG
jgi:hypothetical protein